MSAERVGDTAIWQEVECGDYAVDLPLFERLAAKAPGPILDLGCGIGRVALHLAGHGHDVTGLDADPALLAVLRARAAARGLVITTVDADAREFALDREFALILAPMQLAQIAGGTGGRAAMLRCIAEHLAPGGIAAIALVGDEILFGESVDVEPDVLERDGWAYSSRPLSARLEKTQIVVAGIRETTSPDGDLTAEPSEVRLDVVTFDRVEDEARAAGLSPADRELLPETKAHVASTVLLLGVASNA